MPFLKQPKVKSRLIKIHLPVEPVICVAGVRVGIIAAEIIAGFGILQNTKKLSKLALKQMSGTKQNKT